MKLFKKLRKKKLNTKGFSHIEIFIVLVVVVVVASVGILVYHHDKNTTTAHAGSSQLLQSETDYETTVSIYACIDKVSSSYWSINGIATLNPGVVDSSQYTVGFVVGGNGKGGASSTSTWKSHSSANFQAGFEPLQSSPSTWTVTPIIQLPQGYYSTKGGGGGSFIVDSLPNC